MREQNERMIRVATDAIASANQSELYKIAQMFVNFDENQIPSSPIGTNNYSIINATNISPLQALLDAIKVGNDRFYSWCVFY